MNTLRETILDARNRKVAVGHFNISDSTQLNAIAEVAREMQVPVMIGVSEGERKFIGVRQVAHLIAALREGGYHVFLNADHTKSIEGIQEAVSAGFDETLFDGSQLSIEENIEKAREAVAIARASGRDVLVEGELGYIGQSSAMLDAIPDGAGLDKTDPEVAKRFVTETGVDMLAPSVGNIHGMLKDMPDPRLDIERIAAISRAVQVPLVLHGASGNSDEDIAAAIQAGVAVVHINTEIRAAYRKGIEAGFAQTPDVAPYKYLGVGAEALKEVVRTKLRLFNGLQ